MFSALFTSLALWQIQRKTKLLFRSVPSACIYMFCIMLLSLLASFVLVPFHIAVAECSNRQRAHHSMLRRRLSAVKRSHGVLSAATPKRCRSSLSRPWSTSLVHGAPPPRISSKYSPPAYVYVHGPQLQFLFSFHQQIVDICMLASDSIFFYNPHTCKVMLAQSQYAF